MSGLAAVLAGREAPGVHRWASALDLADVRQAVERAGWRSAHLDTATVTERVDLLAVLGEALGFAEHYGRNLDALHDCLRDLPAPTVLIWDAWAVPASAPQARIRPVLGVLAASAERPVPLEVLLRGGGPDDLAPLLD